MRLAHSPLRAPCVAPNTALTPARAPTPPAHTGGAQAAVSPGFWVQGVGGLFSVLCSIRLMTHHASAADCQHANPVVFLPIALRALTHNFIIKKQMRPWRKLLRPQGVNYASAQLTPGLRAISINLPG
jgi:hypothetical protein